MSKLFTPSKIGTLELKNRFVCSATVECLVSEDNIITDKYLKVHNRLSKGGVGLIIPGNYFVSKSGVAVARNLVIDNDKVIDDLQKLTSIAHDNGSRIIAQLNHGGRQCSPEVIGQTPLSPSSVKDSLTGIRPIEIKTEEIKETIKSFAEAALRTKQAGFDGVQINAAHGYLINQFLSTRTNRRKDNWGGSLENRMRFLIAIYEGIRNKVGKTFPVLVKINAQDNIKKGVTLFESIALCKKLESIGIDAIEISGGIKETGFTTTKGDIPEDILLTNVNMLKRMLFKFIRGKLKKAAKFQEGYHLSCATAIKNSVSVPIILVGGIRRREMMEGILENGNADFVSMSRPFIRQPNLVNKLLEKPDSECIACVNCNRCTVEITVNNKPLRCYYIPQKKEVSK
ncbi:MAG: NADH:flavin oxidoreductase [Desulfobacterales bacterium]|nr:NADH:flavin oxidoreductase [Desulfobacterales bacterium]